MKRARLASAERAALIIGLFFFTAFSFFTIPWASAADGSGTNTISPTSATISSTGNTFVFTFTSAEIMDSGGFYITVPSGGWSAPQETNGLTGYTTASSTGGIIANVEDTLDSAANWTAESGACNSGFSADTATLHEGAASLSCKNSAATNNTKFYRNLSAAENWSTYTNVAFWVRTSANLSAGQLKFQYDDTANLATPIANINLPALTANTWTYVNLALSGGRSSILSLGFQIAGASAQTNNFNIDDILLGPGSPSFPGGGIIRIRFLSFPISTTASVTYGASGGTSGVTAPSTGGIYTFTTQSRVSDSGVSTTIAVSPTVTINNPVPATTSISPTSATAGGSTFTLTVNGSNFVSASVVNWNGSARATTFVSGSQLTATINSSDISSAGTSTVTVVTPSPGGGTSNAQIFTVNNPVPVTTSISPTSKTVGDPGFTLTVNGSNFVSGSIVQFQGSNRTTTFVNSGQITATIPASDLATVGTFNITVFNPTPGGGTSGAQTFTVTAVPPPPDTTAPAAISNLSASGASTSSIDLSWTSPGDDNTSGTANSYDVRYSTSNITAGNWASATQVPGEPAPLISGTPQSMTITGLSPGTTYFFAMETSDEVPNVSSLSNVPSLATLANGGTGSSSPAPSSLPLVNTGGGGPSSAYFSGQVYPGSSIKVLRKSDIVGQYESVPLTSASIADDGKFQIAIQNFLQASYFFAIKATDKDGRESRILPLVSQFVPSGSNLVLKDILIPPTIDLASAAISQGQLVKILGYAAPSSPVEVLIDNTPWGQTISSASGFYTFATSTAGLTLADHTVKARFILSGGIKSDFSLEKIFRVSTLAFPKADLNGDGMVNITDWSIFLFRWGSSDATLKSGVDFNSDGRVDISDFSIFLGSMRIK